MEDVSICPLCGATDRSSFDRRTFRDQPVENQICERCGFIYQSPRMTETELDSFYEANMDLLNPEPSLDLYQSDWPIRTYTAQYPPARTVPGVSGSEGIFINSMVSGGVVIVGGSVQHSILFPQVSIGEEAVIHDSILFNGVQVGEGAELERCIIDKDVRIPPGERIGTPFGIRSMRCASTTSCLSNHFNGVNGNLKSPSLSTPPLADQVAELVSKANSGI